MNKEKEKKKRASINMLECQMKNLIIMNSCFISWKRLHVRNKSFFCLGGFNVNLLNYETDRPTDKFLDDIYSHNFVPYITLPTHTYIKNFD